jgi:soluble lytic murein transglycosylase-like protein
MAALRLAGALLLLAAPTSWAMSAAAQTAPQEPVARIARWEPHIAEASARFGIPPAWIVRVMRAESGGNTHIAGRPIRSRVGAIGLMQLMPGTWAAMRTAHGLGSDPDDPRDNILAGTAYLRLMYDRFGYPGLFAAYNAGPGRYAAYLGRRSSLPGETIAYLAAVTGSARPLPNAPDVTPPQLLFALRRDLEREVGSPKSAPDSGLFAVRRTIP